MRNHHSRHRPATSRMAFVAILALVITACGGNGDNGTADDASATGDGEADTFDWQAYSGTELEVYIPDTGQVDTLEAHLDEFEELTGISVTLEVSDVTSYRETLPVQLTSRSSAFDVMATFPEVDGLQFSHNGWYVDLGDYVNDATLTDPEYDFDDFPEGVQQAMTVDGQLATVLWEMQTALMYYRKDVLEDAGLDVPTTFEEWRTAADQIHDPDEGLYGFALRGIAYQVTTPFSAFLHAHCGTWVEDGQAAIAQPEAMAAWEEYGAWGEYGPPGMSGFDWPVPSQQFAQGNIFAFLDINLFVPELEDPDRSTVAGNVGYAPVPAGDCGATPFIGGWGYAISPFAENPEAAWYFIQWATSKDINLEMKVEGWPSPRASAWESEEFQAADPTPEFTEVVLESTEIASAQMNPPVAPGVEAREIAGLVGHEALQGVSGDGLQTLAEQQAAELQRLIDAGP